MIHVNGRLLFKPQLSDFSVLVVHHAVVLLLLTHSCGGKTAHKPLCVKVRGHSLSLDIIPLKHVCGWCMEPLCAYKFEILLFVATWTNTDF